MLLNLIKKILCLIFIGIYSNLFAAQPIKVITYNVRLITKGDEKNGNGWTKRAIPMCDMLKFYDPDIIGCQEMTIVQKTFFQDYFSNFYLVGSDSGDQGTLGDFNAILFRKDSFDLIENGDFWITDKIDRQKKGWDAAYIRLCSWVHLKVKQDSLDFFVFNTHLDNKGEVAKKEGAKMVRDSIIAISKGNPFVLIGDMNSGQDSESYQVFTKDSILFDSQKIADFSYIPNGTFNKFSTSRYSSSFIDHIFVSKHFDISRYGILTNSYWKKETIEEEVIDGGKTIKKKSKAYVNRLPSDHYPVMICTTITEW